MYIPLSLLILTVNEVCAQKFGISQVVSFTNGIIPNILHGLSYDYNNVVFSPYGLASGLSMVLEGMDNDAVSNIANILHFDSPNVRQILRNGFRSLQEEFEKSKTASESSGSYNRAYLHSSIPLVPEYKSILEKYYKVQLTHNETEVNSTELVLELQTDTGVMSHWKNFDKLAVYTYLSHESSSPFVTENGTTVEVPMIPQVGEFRAGYIPKLNSQAAELHLENRHTTLFLIMPDNREGIRDTLASMVDLNLADLPGALPLTDAEISVPQLVVINSELNLTKLLKKLGLRQIFTKTGLIKSIKQSAYFATSFVSINSVGATYTLLHKEIPKRKKRQISSNLIFNKPFMFFLLHKPSGAALLSGIVKYPMQKP